MTKNEFREWCDRYAMFHYINTLGGGYFGFNIKEGFGLDNSFLTENLKKFKANGKIDDYDYEKNGMWFVFIKEN